MERMTVPIDMEHNNSFFRDHIDLKSLVDDDMIQSVLNKDCMYGELSPLYNGISEFITIDTKRVAFRILDINIENMTTVIETIDELAMSRAFLDIYKMVSKDFRFIPRIYRDGCNRYHMVTIDAHCMSSPEAKLCFAMISGETGGLKWVLS